MKATIIFLPPFLHSCQNVPPAINTTNTGTNTTDGGQHRQHHRAEDDSSSNGGSSLRNGSSGSGSCCQWAHNKNYYEKHATPRRTGGDDAAASSNNSHKQNQNARSARNGRERRKSHLLHLSATNAPRVVYCGATTAQPNANIRAAYATTTTATTTTAPIEATTIGTTKSSLENEYREVATAAVLERSEAHASVRATLKTHSCLADSLRLRNRRQLVMPIVENSLVNATATPHNSQLLREQALEQVVNESALVQRRPVTATAVGTELTPRALRAPTTTPTAVKPAAPADIADSNNKHKHISQTTTTTLDGRCFKDNGDICMAADELNALHDAKASTAQAKTREHMNSRQSEAHGVAAVALLAKLSSRTLQRLCGLRASQQVLLPSLHKRMQMDDNCAVWWSKLLLLALLMLMLTSSANCWTGRQDVSSNCTFPARWEGSWFLSGYQQSIHIKGSQFSYRGKCAASDGNKYLIVDEKGCHRCLVIYEKHKNVLQYKESECEGDSMYMHQTNPSAMAMRSVLKQNDHRGGAHPNLNNNNGHSRLSSSDQYIMRSNDDMNDYFCKGRETLQNLCDQIPGDALLYSLFRESAEPVKCPLKGPFIFTYNRGHGECKNPVSNIESCTEDSRLLLSFQACPDVQGTESTVEELTCLATWKDGNSRYLVGLVSHHHAISNEERYRCFVYEKISSLMGGPSIISSKDAEYKLAQSGDATCNGLDSAEVGSRIMSLRKPPLAERCDFPVWFKGPRHWHALMGNAVYNYHSNDGSVHIIKPNGFMETRALCEQINKQTPTEMVAVVHYTTGCQSGFMCMMFYRRDTHVIEIQTGKQASRLEDACAPDHFDINRMPFITLLASNPDPQICPMEGLYNLRGAIGPPYLTTRHKRNHNNKVHTGHGHHHGQSEAGIGGGSGIGGYGHKRHATLSFRNSDRIEKGSWHANTRGLPVRSRRAATTSSSVAMQRLNVLNAQHRKLPSGSEANNVIVAASEPANATNGTAVGPATRGLTSVGFIVDADSDAVGENDGQKQRNRRDAPGCVTNYKAQRRLWVGCTEPDVIDVRPKCSDDDDEEYFCHGSWSENGTVYIIARHKGTKHGVCISYRPTEGTAAKLVIGDACYRGTLKPPEHHLVANLSIFGKCGDTGSATSALQTANWLVTLAVALLTTLLGEQISASQQRHGTPSVYAIGARTLNRR